MNSEHKKKNHAAPEEVHPNDTPRPEGQPWDSGEGKGMPQAGQQNHALHEEKNKHSKGDKVEISKQEYEDLKKKVQELEGLREKFLHAAADFENAKKRNARDKEEFIKFSQERIMRELLPVLDNFDRAIGHVNAVSVTANGEEALQQNFKTLLSGVQMVQKQLFDILKRNGLKRLETIGQKFDPHMHEAVAHVAEEGKEDHIVDELESGYMLHERLLRAARVRVRLSPKQADPSETKKDEIT
ncbi:MAG TPA: nucleotide exchange factor GrpE [Candidatus Omnitrophota bacterium]|nr:nucleotide exchange factor GrpE [Candidatus Omnitrophota bacterium]